MKTTNYMRWCDEIRTTASKQEEEEEILRFLA